jgi:hypothetical protein
VLDRIRQRQDEDDEAFLMRAERVVEMEEKALRNRARHLVAVAVRASDKPGSLPQGEESVRRIATGSVPSYVSARALLLARSMCRELQSASTGPDPIAQDAYQMLSQLALEALQATEGT